MNASRDTGVTQRLAREGCTRRESSATRPFKAATVIACGVAMLYLMIGAWQDIAFVSSGERLLRIGLMIGFAFAGGAGFTSRSRRGSAPFG